VRLNSPESGSSKPIPTSPQSELPPFHRPIHHTSATASWKRPATSQDGWPPTLQLVSVTSKTTMGLLADMVRNRDGPGPGPYPAREYVSLAIRCMRISQLIALDRHEFEPLQVLQMDTAHRQNHLRLGCRRAFHGRIRSIQDRCESEAPVSHIPQLADINVERRDYGISGQRGEETCSWSGRRVGWLASLHSCTYHWQRTTMVIKCIKYCALEDLTPTWSLEAAHKKPGHLPSSPIPKPVI
jgi:hypothetical protein